MAELNKLFSRLPSRAAGVRARLDEEVRPDVHEDLLEHERIEGVLAEAHAEEALAPVQRILLVVYEQRVHLAVSTTPTHTSLFSKLFLGCIETKFCNQIRIFSGFSRSTKLSS